MLIGCQGDAMLTEIHLRCVRDIRQHIHTDPLRPSASRSGRYREVPDEGLGHANPLVGGYGFKNSLSCYALDRHRAVGTADD